MIITNHTKEQSREFLKQEALKEINTVSDFTGFHSRVFCVIAKYKPRRVRSIDSELTGQ